MKRNTGYWTRKMDKPYWMLTPLEKREVWHQIAQDSLDMQRRFPGKGLPLVDILSIGNSIPL
jgi:hypothetical protein